jgi:hypothetical protein
MEYHWIYPDFVSDAIYATANNKYAPANTTANNINANQGLSQRISYINLNINEFSLDDVDTSLVSSLIDGTEIKKLYLLHISNITDGVGAMSSPFVQTSVKATIMLKDIHTLFEVFPISKSLNFKIHIF